MIELGELEKRHQDFENRHVRIVAVSNDDQETAQKTQDAFPHLVVVADANRELSTLADVIHPHSGPGGGDTAAPATLLVDRDGTVRWVYRPDRYLSRLSPDELLAEIDRHLPAGG